MNTQVILLVEDNDDDIELAQRAFEKLGLSDQIRVARSGEEALEFLFGGASSVKLVLLDLNLPKAPGLDVLRQIRLNAATRHISIVVLTVSKKEPDLLLSFTMGISDYLIKPIDPARFAQIYRTYITEAKT
jgi:two-component system, response regulator